jgi:hypothetical protein
MALKFEQGKKYETKSKNVVKCLAVQKDKAGKEFALCAYEKIGAEGHESLINAAHKWDLDGKWLQFPGGIHDIVKEV